MYLSFWYHQHSTVLVVLHVLPHLTVMLLCTLKLRQYGCDSVLCKLRSYWYLQHETLHTHLKLASEKQLVFVYWQLYQPLTKRRLVYGSALVDTCKLSMVMYIIIREFVAGALCLLRAYLASMWNRQISIMGQRAKTVKKRHCLGIICHPFFSFGNWCRPKKSEWWWLWTVMMIS